MYPFLKSGLEFLVDFEVNCKSEANRVNNYEGKLDKEDVTSISQSLKFFYEDICGLTSALVKDVKSLIKEAKFGVEHCEELDERIVEQMEKLSEKFNYTYKNSIYLLNSNHLS